jgi:hypothetical protein
MTGDELQALTDRLNQLRADLADRLPPNPRTDVVLRRLRDARHYLDSAANGWDDPA